MVAFAPHVGPASDHGPRAVTGCSGGVGYTDGSWVRLQFFGSRPSTTKPPEFDRRGLGTDSVVLEKAVHAFCRIVYRNYTGAASLKARGPQVCGLS